MERGKLNFQALDAFDTFLIEYIQFKSFFHFNIAASDRFILDLTGGREMQVRSVLPGVGSHKQM